MKLMLTIELVRVLDVIPSTIYDYNISVHNTDQQIWRTECGVRFISQNHNTGRLPKLFTIYVTIDSRFFFVFRLHLYVFHCNRSLLFGIVYMINM